nr:lysozyme inhibitor LprI family protein [uncultured Sphingomonas sp.]
MRYCLKMSGIAALMAGVIAAWAPPTSAQTSAAPAKTAPSRLTQAQIARMTPDQLGKYFTPAYQKCMDSVEAKQGVTSAMMDCLGAEEQRQEAALNATYQRVMARQTAPDKVKLRKMQRAWLAQRDPICTRRLVDMAGTAATLMHSDCALQETVRRTLWLKAYRP